MYTFVLVEPENPDNIGAAARALKNTGIEDFRLVKPPRAWKSRSKKMAVWAYDQIRKARVFPDLKKAVKDCHVVIGTTCRRGAYRGQHLDFNEAIELAQNAGAQSRVAFLFGKESKGLSNEDVAVCDYVITIPTSKSYTSLNLAQAVLIAGFKLMEMENQKQNSPKPRSPLVPVRKEEIEQILSELRDILIRLNYRDEGPSVIDRIGTTFHGLLKRSGLARHELNMFKGLFRRLRSKLN